VLSFIFAINFLSSNRNEISEDMANNEVLKLQEKTLEYGSSLEYAEFIDMLFERNVDDAISAIEIFINDKKS
ncbi:MAG: hypothetical protein K2I70_03480, partial [Bacilli bacterium]|nr:hypothetical protein [Bacilli bacterium]